MQGIIGGIIEKGITEEIDVMLYGSVQEIPDSVDISSAERGYYDNISGFIVSMTNQEYLIDNLFQSRIFESLGLISMREPSYLWHAFYHHSPTVDTETASIP